MTDLPIHSSRETIVLIKLPSHLNYSFVASNFITKLNPEATQDTQLGTTPYKNNCGLVLNQRFVHLANFGFGGQLIASKALRFLAETVGNNYQSHSKGMTEKEIIEKIDLLFEKITDFNMFSINNIFFKEIIPNEKNKDEVENFHNIVSETKLFGMNKDLFEKYNNNGWFSLTEKGKELKISNFELIKFTKKSKPKKIHLYKIIPIILTVLFGSLNIYQKYDYRELKNDFDSVKIERDSVKQKLIYLNNRTVEYKENTLSDTLQTKKESYLKS